MQKNLLWQWDAGAVRAALKRDISACNVHCDLLVMKGKNPKTGGMILYSVAPCTDISPYKS